VEKEGKIMKKDLKKYKEIEEKMQVNKLQ